MDTQRKILLILLLLISSGCRQLVSVPSHVPAPVIHTAEEKSIPPLTLRERFDIAGISVEGRHIEYVDMGEGEDVTLFIGGIHGDEGVGTQLLGFLYQHFQKHPYLMKNRKVVILFAANPDGLVHKTRYNARGVDLNRNFPTANRINNDCYGHIGFSEPETRAIGHLIRVYTPDRIITIHEPLSCIDYDGPGEILARNMAQSCGLPVRKLGLQPGSLGSYAGAGLNIPTITFELPEYAPQLTEELLWEFFGNAMVAGIGCADLYVSKDNIPGDSPQAKHRNLPSSKPDLTDPCLRRDSCK